jgi:thiol-disulfide isomerase/thioredoxin/outer membrane lipoprotein-sorting protein
MPCPLTRLPGALLAALLLAAPAVAGPLAAPALVDSVAAHYARLAAYHFEGVITVSTTGDSLPQPVTMEIPFRFAAVRPLKLRNDLLNPYMPATFISDGDSLLVGALSLHQFTVQPAPRIEVGGPVDPATAMLQPLQPLTQLATNLADVGDLGRDTVHTAQGTVSCRVIRLTYRAGAGAGGSELLPRTLWIDEARMIALRDSSGARLHHPTYGPLLSVQTQRMVVADVAGGGPDSLYERRAPAGAERVERLGGARPPEPDLAGKPAKDFTLATLEGRAVKLSALRGKVVVLDFWATWCGPCRRWMPIVARLERELRERGVRFYAVNERDTPEQVRRYLRETKLVVPVLMDRTGSVGAAYGAQSIPLTVVVGRDGKVVRALVGLHPEEDLRAALAAAGVSGL